MARTVTVDDTTGKGVYAADGSFRVTVVDGNSYVGLYAADGSFNVVIVEENDTPFGIYHASGALRGVIADGTEALFAPNGALYLYGLTTPITGSTWRASGWGFGTPQKQGGSATSSDELIILLM